jgi:hypothetical protein
VWQDSVLPFGHSSETIAESDIFLSDIKANRWENPCYLNLYGAPATHKDQSTDARANADAMNSGRLLGSRYHGRILLSAELQKVDWRSKHSSEETLSKIGRDSFFCKHATGGSCRFCQHRIQPALAVEPFHVVLCMLAGCALQPHVNVFVRVRWGSECIDHAAEHLQRTGPDGSVRWDNNIFELELPLPADLSQVPDIFLELLDRRTVGGLTVDTRTHFLRVNPTKVGSVSEMLYSCTKLPSGGNDSDIDVTRRHKSQIAGVWCHWTRDECSNVPEWGANCDPRFLMALGVDRPSNMKTRSTTFSLAHHNSTHKHAKTSLQFPKRFRVTELFKSTDDVEQKREQTLEQLRSGARYRQHEQPFLLRVCIYQARHLPAVDLAHDEDGLPDPFVRIDVPHIALAKSCKAVGTSFSICKRNTRCPQYFEIHDFMLNLPGNSSRDPSLIAAPSIKVSVVNTCCLLLRVRHTLYIIYGLLGNVRR